MKQLLEFAKRNILKIAKNCYDSPANFWQAAGITTISVYHLCQIIIVGVNKDTPKKEKAFLIPQEIMDGIINIATFAVFAGGFKRLGRTLVKKEIVVPHNKNKEVFAEEFATTTNLIGSLFAVNVASPIIRNKFGANIQKTFVKKQDEKQNVYPQKSLSTLSYTNKLKI